MNIWKSFRMVLAFASASTICIADGKFETPLTGAFTVSFTTENILGDAASKVESAIPVDEVISWEIYVPPNYTADKPSGLFVFVSPIPTGRIPGKWRRVMDEQNLIWIAANKSGNRVVVSRRMLFAALAVLVAEKSYSLDTRRFYVSGFSGGGKVASRLATVHAQLFKGGFFMSGVEIGRGEVSRDVDLMASNRYVLLCGSEDQALRSCNQAYRAYQAEGIEDTRLMVIRGMGHNTPDASDFEKAIAFLDSSGKPVE